MSGLRILTLIAMSVLAGGCQLPGPRTSIDRARTAIASGSPVTVQIEDDSKKGVASGVGPARYTSITEDEIQTMQSGTTPRDLYFKLPNGTQLNLSSGSDINVEGMEYTPSTGTLKVKRFSTSSSEPLRAGNEAYDRLVAWWQALSADQRAVRIAEIEAAADLAPDLKDFIIGTLLGL